MSLKMSRNWLLCKSGSNPIFIHFWVVLGHFWRPVSLDFTLKGPPGQGPPDHLGDTFFINLTHFLEGVSLGFTYEWPLQSEQQTFLKINFCVTFFIFCVVVLKTCFSWIPLDNTLSWVSKITQQQLRETVVKFLNLHYYVNLYVVFTFVSPNTL